MKLKLPAKLAHLNPMSWGAKLTDARWVIFLLFWGMVSVYALWVIYQKAFIDLQFTARETAAYVPQKTSDIKKISAGIEERKQNLEKPAAQTELELFNFSIAEEAIWRSKSGDKREGGEGDVPSRPGGWN